MTLKERFMHTATKRHAATYLHRQVHMYLYTLTPTHTIIKSFLACSVHSLYPVWCSASGPSLAALPNKLLAVHSILNAEAL